MKNDKKYFVFDFDCTFIQVEALEELALISLKNHPEREKILNEIKQIRNSGLEGKIPFSKSLIKRIELFQANRNHLEQLVKRLKKKISISVARNKEFFKKFSENIYVITEGFKEFTIPVLKQFFILKKNIFANTFKFDEQGNIIGFDEENILSHDYGKIEQLRQLNLDGDVYVIGDGYTDYQIKKAGFANKIFAFTENIKRKSIMEKADYVTPSLDEFLYLNKLPMAISYPKNRINALLIENIAQEGLERFQEEGYDIEIDNRGLNEKELAERIRNLSILGIRSKTRITSKILQNANRLMAIGAFCIGTNQIDLKSCAKKGIAVFNAPYSNTRSVVEMVLGEIIILIRNIFDKSTKLHNGIWDKSAIGNNEIRGKKLGIVGYGNIGSQLSVLAESLGMDVYYYDIVEKLALGNAKKCNSLRQLLKKVDVVSIHVDGRPENKNLIGESKIKIIKEGSIFLNTSRGFVVDIPALVKYIKNGKIRGAAIDVFPEEPMSNKEKFVTELQSLPNVILTPHIGGSTEEAQRNIADFVSTKIIDYVNTGSTTYSVNFPNLQLPKLRNAHRLIHIHENVPGIIAKINSVLAKNGINVEGQYLKTNENIGYVITDISKKYNQNIIDEIKSIPSTIKFRVLY